jgi:DNA repair protein RecN (Recombination protein N)
VKRRHGPTLDEVIDKGRALACERDLLLQSGDRVEDLEKALADASQSYLQAAREVSVRRRAAAGGFSNQLEDLLAELAMSGTRFEVRFNQVDLPPDAWSERGIDEAEFFVSPNPGEDLHSLARIVSGGELSRIMLALKTMAVDESEGRTLVFDEVDAGIGGRVADVVGSRLRELGRRFQVVCITHLPQIAAHAGTQFRIDKTVRGVRTVTSVQRLEESGRIEEIGRMIAGLTVTEPVRASARELLEASRAGAARLPAVPGTSRGKQKAKVGQPVRRSSL